jgi:hypothetical protein
MVYLLEFFPLSSSKKRPSISSGLFFSNTPTAQNKMSFDLSEGQEEELKKRIEKIGAACFYLTSIVIQIAIGL